MMAEGETSVTRDLVLIGGGEHASVVLDAARSEGRWSVIGYVDVAPRPPMDAIGLSWLGDDAGAADLVRGLHCIVAVGAVGDPERRRDIVRRYESLGVSWATVVHDSAVVSPSAELGLGAVVLASSVINAGARVGEHSIVNTGSILEHGVELEAFVHVGPGAVIGGGTRVSAAAFVGLGARVRDHLHIGAGSVIGMGAVVVHSVAEGAVVVGVPARPIDGPPHEAKTRSDVWPLDA